MYNILGNRAMEGKYQIRDLENDSIMFGSLSQSFINIC
jgi:hypothetical protein